MYTATVKVFKGAGTDRNTGDATGEVFSFKITADSAESVTEKVKRMMDANMEGVE